MRSYIQEFDLSDPGETQIGKHALRSYERFL